MTKKITDKIWGAVGRVGYAFVWLTTTVGVANATESAIDSVEDLAICGKELVDPTPILVKEGWFKQRVVKYNPITGTLSKYAGSKKPVNKKAIAVRKGDVK